MQSKEIITSDARTFGEIWNSLDRDQRDELSICLYKNRCCGTRHTIYNWAKGKTAPVEPLVREGVAKVVGKFLGSVVFSSTLFPRR